MKVVSRRMFGLFLPGDRDFPSGGIVSGEHEGGVLLAAHRAIRPDVEVRVEPIDVLLVRDAGEPFRHNETIEPAVFQAIVALLQGRTFDELLGRAS